MDIRESPTEQVRAVIDWLRERAKPDKPLAAQTWGEFCTEMLDRALVLEQITLPKLKDPQVNIAKLEIIRGVHNGQPIYQEEQQQDSDLGASGNENGAYAEEPSIR